MAIAPAITIGSQVHFLGDRGQRAGFVLLVAFLLSFLFIRTSTRLIRNPSVTWWPGNVTTGSGLHLHHLIWGILLMLVAGFLGFALDPSSPWTEIFAGLFGVGAGLTLDEFALWVHLEDVYWAEEGRSSFDAVVIAAMIGGLILLGGVPLNLNNEDSIGGLVIAVAIDVLLAVAAILKGKPVLGLTGIFLPVVSLVGAVRLASPTSPWARRRYEPGGRKLERAQARWARSEARRRRFSDAIAGAPTREQ
ncbi:MAG: hypothetical protein JOY58_11305 [Solirubrobacterales bacterium]|nr:hypothetical protein [Solirubrobacterales bacterium]